MTNCDITTVIIRRCKCMGDKAVTHCDASDMRDEWCKYMEDRAVTLVTHFYSYYHA